MEYLFPKELWTLRNTWNAMEFGHALPQSPQSILIDIFPLFELFFFLPKKLLGITDFMHGLSFSHILQNSMVV